MTPLEAIQRDIEEAPTIMCLSDEQEFCRRLMEIPKADLLEQRERVGIILDRLHESHHLSGIRSYFRERLQVFWGLGSCIRRPVPRLSSVGRNDRTSGQP